MKLIKTIDERFAEIGFVKVKENEYSANYERNTKYGYIQCLDLVNKASGFHIIQSYEKGLNTDGFNNCVGITMYEAKLCRKKMKLMGWKERIANEDKG